jgi:hypothetical protein
MNLKTLLKNYHSNMALIVGNGINRYNSDAGLTSWDAMLLELWERHTQDEPKDIPLGISLTEFYDALDLTSHSVSKNLQKEFCAFLEGWQAKAHHHRIMRWAQVHAVPVLTTNFDETLSDCLQLSLQHHDALSFTDFYPWSSYFAADEIDKPAQQFAVWHINGIKRYSRSIRLGLSHYMGSVERARALIHKGGDKRLYAEKHQGKWNGYNTWLDCVFKNDLVFMGLGLDTSEIFLRWLLIERAKYFKANPQHKRAAFYLHAGRDLSQGQIIFLKSVGCEIVKLPSYDHLYGDAWALR